MKALVLDAEKKTANVKDMPKPVPGPTELLIRVKAVALNAVDPLYVRNPLGSTGRVVGSDFAGVVESLGDEVPGTSGMSTGVRVAGFLQGACSINHRPGAFAEFLVCPWDLTWRVPDDMDLQAAAGISLCGLTAAQAWFGRMGLPSPFTSRQESARNVDEKEPSAPLNFFIYGATTSVGLYAAQFVHRFAESSGKPIRLFGAASKKNHGMLKAEPYSYNGLVDYRDEDWPTKVLEFTDGAGIDYAYDCISEGSTVPNTVKTLAPNAKMGVVRSRQGGAWNAQNLAVEPSYGAAWEGLGEVVEYQGMHLPASKESRHFTVTLYRWLAAGGKLQPNPPRLMPGGLESIVKDGFRLLGSGTMNDRDSTSDKAHMKALSGEKMIYSIAE